MFVISLSVPQEASYSHPPSNPEPQSLFLAYLFCRCFSQSVSLLCVCLRILCTDSCLHLSPDFANLCSIFKLNLCQLFPLLSITWVWEIMSLFSSLASKTFWKIQSICNFVFSQGGLKPQLLQPWFLNFMHLNTNVIYIFSLCLCKLWKPYLE